jgi:hypothetical protein
MPTRAGTFLCAAGASARTVLLVRRLDGCFSLESKEFVSALLEVERRGLAAYEATLSSLDSEARELIELELIPRQRKHIDKLSAILSRLPA